MLLLKVTHERIVCLLKDELLSIRNKLQMLKEERYTDRKKIIKYSNIAFSKQERVTFFLDKKDDFYICSHGEIKDQLTLIAINLKYEDSFIETRNSILYAKIKRDFFEQGALHVFIQDIRVPEKDRNIGIGSFLLKFLKTICKEKGITTIKGDLSAVDIKDHGDRLFYFYKENGFKINKKETGDLEIECTIRS